MALDVDDSMSDSSSESSFSSDASIDNNNLADDAKVGSNEPDVAIDDPGGQGLFTRMGRLLDCP